LINRMPDLYSEPDRFLPERWTAINPSPFEYAVFSAGPRNCPGYAFGLSVVKVGIAAILTRYRISLAPQSTVDYQVRLTLTPRGPVMGMLKRPDCVFTTELVRGSLCDLVRFPEEADEARAPSTIASANFSAAPTPPSCSGPASPRAS